MGIDWGRCVMRGTCCRDCVVTTMDPPGVTGYPEQARCHLDEAEVRAISVLAEAGLVPPLSAFAARLAKPARPADLGSPRRQGVAMVA
jgi:hypothetical protein